MSSNKDLLTHLFFEWSQNYCFILFCHLSANHCHLQSFDFILNNPAYPYVSNLISSRNSLTSYELILFIKPPEAKRVIMRDKWYLIKHFSILDSLAVILNESLLEIVGTKLDFFAFENKTSQFSWHIDVLRLI